ncbi:MAG TPA: hypothetical protein PLE50_10410 [Rhabdaerophilum sp.]|nr:hypothetical protein [Rhabdaerophilum sp.]
MVEIDQPNLPVFENGIRRRIEPMSSASRILDENARGLIFAPEDEMRVASGFAGKPGLPDIAGLLAGGLGPTQHILRGSIRNHQGQSNPDSPPAHRISSPDVLMAYRIRAKAKHTSV